MTLENQLTKNIADKIEGAPVEELVALILDIYEDAKTEKRPEIIHYTILKALYITGYDYFTSYLLADITIKSIGDHRNIN